MTAPLSAYSDSLWCLRTAAGGAAVWILLWLVPLQPDPILDQIARLIALAVLVIVPLYLDLVARADALGQNAGPHTSAVRLLPFAGVATVGSFLVPVGTTAAALAIPFAVFSLLAAASGVVSGLRARREGVFNLAELAKALGPLLLPVSAGALLAQRGGAPVGDFSSYVLLLTVTHFIVAGFALFVWAAFAHRFLQSGIVARIIAMTCVPAILIGVPTTAIGIATAPAVEALGAVLLAGGALALGMTVLLSVPAITLTRPLASVLLAVSAGSLAIAMFFAMRQGLTGVIDLDPLPPRAMLLAHGWLNAVGFALWGGLAWRRLRGTPEMAEQARGASR